MLSTGAALLAVRRAVVSHLAGRRRLDVHSVHLQPGGDQRRSLHRRQSPDPLRQPHVAVARQTAHRCCLDPVVCHLLSAADRLERRKYPEADEFVFGRRA